MSSLNGNLISSTYQSLIKTSNNLAITGSVQLSDGNGNDIPMTVSTTAIIITGSLLGTAATASFVTTAQTASYVLNAISSSFAQTASFVTTAQTASFVATSQTASIATNAITLNSTASAIFAITGSNTFTGTQVVSGSLRLFQSASFTLPTSQPATAVAGNAFFSGSFLYIFDGSVYRSASFS